MPEAEVLYSDVKFTKKKGNPTETTSSLAEPTYSEVRIAKTEPSTELPGSLQVVSHEGSKVKSQKVPLLILCVLLAAVVIALCYVSHDNIQTRRSFNKLKDENEALKKNLTKRLPENIVPPSGPQTPEPEPTLFKGDSCLKCDAGWERHLGKCYYFSNTYLSWEESRRLCQSRGGDLVKIDSEEEQEFLEEKVKNKMTFYEDKFWIGLTDSKEENKWIWVDGSTLSTSLSFWFGHEPDDWNGTNPEGEDCARMGEKQEAKVLNCWFDKSCNIPHRSICEKPEQTGRRQDVCVVTGEALASQQPAVSHGRSKVRLERVALLFLAALLGAAITVIYRLSEDIETKRSLKNLEDEYETLKKNLTETLSKMMVPPSCPQTPEPEPTLFKGDSCLKCDAGWEQGLGKCYYFSNTYSSLEESRRSCQTLGGDLVKIDSMEEQEFLEKKVKNKMRYNEDKFWIGLTDSKEESKWIWADGSPLTTSLSFWFKGEPNNLKTEDPAGEHCVRMGKKEGAKDLKCWFDRSCNMPQRSICEKPAQTGRRQDVCV
ncbi:secretory phospholipase A2 receptor-like [Scomber scombrus]|uniref:secretory phospholipase A2 receptor-like n=1 Tax=Scomber scombrus TaxID=13677 RepID=UPI002DDBCBEB|nr:secretory phospholipase A2 receptor-like [Scomber scombrus]